MKGKKVINIRCHIGCYIFAGAQTLDSSKLKDCTMELTPVGVLVKATVGKDVRQVLIPFANITQIEMVDEKP